MRRINLSICFFTFIFVATNVLNFGSAGRALLYADEPKGIDQAKIDQLKQGYFPLSPERNIIPLMGGAYQDTGDNPMSYLSNGNYLNTISTLKTKLIDGKPIAQVLSENGHNTVKIYLPAASLNEQKFADLKALIKEIYAGYGLKFLILHSAGLYAPDSYCTYNLTPEKKESIKNEIRLLAQEVKELGDAVSCVQIGNENEYFEGFRQHPFQHKP